MYFIISRLDEQRLARMEFLVNFGVGLEYIRQMADIMEKGGVYEEVKDVFRDMPFLILLKIHKYFFWADKKLH